MPGENEKPIHRVQKNMADETMTKEEAKKLPVRDKRQEKRMAINLHKPFLNIRIRT